MIRGWSVKDVTNPPGQATAKEYRPFHGGFPNRCHPKTCGGKSCNSTWHWCERAIPAEKE